MAEKQGYEHPCTKEGWSDRLYRYVNEMVELSSSYFSIQDFEG